MGDGYAALSRRTGTLGCLCMPYVQANSVISYAMKACDVLLANVSPQKEKPNLRRRACGSLPARETSELPGTADGFTLLWRRMVLLPIMHRALQWEKGVTYHRCKPEKPDW